MGTRRTPSVPAPASLPVGVLTAILLLLLNVACTTSTTPAADARAATDVSVTTTTTTPPSTTASPTTTTSTTSSTTSTTSSTTSTTSTSTPSTTVAVGPPPNAWLPETGRAFDALARANPAVSMTVVRDGIPVLRLASGLTIEGTSATSDTPMVVASVSKLLTAAAVARLAERGAITIDAPVPWQSLGFTPHPGWDDVTVRELLDHTSGMPVARSSWFTGDDVCWLYLPQLMTQPPRPHRGEWTYSNGNYCALGLLVGTVTGQTLDAAAEQLLLDPVGATGVHLTTDGQQPIDILYRQGVERLSRLGGAGTFIVSTDDLAAVLASVTAEDQAAMTWPAVMFDQYGWGHTGTVDGAKACAWVLESGRTVIVTTVAGESPSTGGAVCDRTVPAIAADLRLGDLGFGAGTPRRTPP